MPQWFGARAAAAAAAAAAAPNFEQRVVGRSGGGGGGEWWKGPGVRGRGTKGYVGMKRLVCCETQGAGGARQIIIRSRTEERLCFDRRRERLQGPGMFGGDGSAAVGSLLCVCHHRLLAGTVVSSPRSRYGWYRLLVVTSQSSRRRSSASQARVPLSLHKLLVRFQDVWANGDEAAKSDEMRPKRDGRQFSSASPSFCVLLCFALLCSALLCSALLCSALLRLPSRLRGGGSAVVKVG